MRFSTGTIASVLFCAFNLGPTHGSAIPGGGQSPSSTRLPSPTGPYKVGATDIALTDTARYDLFNTTILRKLMVTIYYPTSNPSTSGSPYLTPTVASQFVGPDFHDLPPLPSNARKNSFQGAKPLPLPNQALKRVLFSHGGGTSRLLHTALLEDLASYGYIAISIDHSYDARIVEFPDSPPVFRYEFDTFEPYLLDWWYQQRVDDIAFVERVTADLSVLFGPSRKGSAPVKSALVAHSFGGSAIAGAMIAQPGKYAGGFNYDGAHWNSSIAGDVKGPFFLMGPPEREPPGDLSWVSFKAAQSGWVREAHVQEAKHYSFTDFSVWGELLGWGPEADQWIGSIDGLRFTKIQRAYVKDFLDWVLWGKKAKLVNGENAAFPEVDFV